MKDALYLKTICLINLDKLNEACKELTKLKSLDITKDYTDLKIDCGI